MKITLDDLYKKKACIEGLLLWQEYNLHKLDFDKIKTIKCSNLSYTKWLAKTFKLTIVIKSFKDSTGFCSKRKFENGLEVYFENSDEIWSKHKYKDGLETYYEDSNDFWSKHKYKDGLEVYCKASTSFWSKRKYKNGLEVYYKDSTGIWRKTEYKDGLVVYYEDSTGIWEKYKYKDRLLVNMSSLYSPPDLSFKITRKELK